MFADVKKALRPLTDKLQQLLAGKTYPEIQKVNFGLFKKYTGQTGEYGSYLGLSKGTLDGVVDGFMISSHE